MLQLSALFELPTGSSTCHLSSSWGQSSRLSVVNDAFGKNVRSRQIVHAARGQRQQQQQWMQSDVPPAVQLGPTVDRRKAVFTYKPAQNLPGPSLEEPGQHQAFRKPQVQPQAQRRQQQQQQQRQQKRLQHKQHARKQQNIMQPDSAADDLDALAAQAAALLTTTSISSTPVPAATADLSAQPSLIYVVPEQEPEAAAAAALISSRTPRYAQSDKLHLTQEAARDIARRLRKTGPPTPGQPVVRIFRYGIDDLRLYKALDLAGLEGRVVVVDSMQFADAVITTHSKRTGKAVNLAVARRAAASAGVPYLQLKAVSPQRLLEALGPLLGLQYDSTVVAATQQDGATRSMQSQSGRSGVASHAGQQQQQEAGLSHVLQNAQGLRLQPRLLRWEELDGDGSEELLQLLWSPLVAAGNAGNVAADNSSSSSSHSNSSVDSAAGTTAVVVGASPRWLAWRASQAGPCAPKAVMDLVRSVDIEDTRDEMVPANPTERAGEKHKLLKPLRHGSRLKHKRLQRYLRLKQVPW